MPTLTHLVLIAIDVPESSWNIIAYAAGVLDKQTRSTLYHVFYRVPCEDLEDDPFLVNYPLFGKQVADLKIWLSRERESKAGMMAEAKKLLVEQGFDPQNIRIKVEEKKASVARDILEELKEGEYDTVIVGRRQKSAVKHFLLGSVSNKIVHHADNVAVWVVE